MHGTNLRPLLPAQGMDTKTVSHMLGHTDAGFTMNTYLYACNGHNATNGDKYSAKPNHRNREQKKEQSHTFHGIAKGSRSKLLEPELVL